VDKAELPATTHPAMQRHMAEEQIFILNPNEEQRQSISYSAVSLLNVQFLK
jgi:hypothetical protein